MGIDFHFPPPDPLPALERLIEAVEKNTEVTEAASRASTRAAIAQIVLAVASIGVAALFGLGVLGDDEGPGAEVVPVSTTVVDE